MQRTEKRLKTWAGFAGAVAEIRKQYGYHEDRFKDGRSYQRPNIVLFRGQSDASWAIETTLERHTTESFTIEQYRDYACRCRPELESVTGRTWPVSVPPPPEETEADLSCLSPIERGTEPDVEYWVYLRHHGFPSPLLDWSASPYVAAYFAFRFRIPNAKRVAVYAYVSSTAGRAQSVPRIVLIGPDMCTHPRHFSQNAWYTMALRDVDGNQHCICKHEEALSCSKLDEDQLIKITLPVSTRKDALKSLVSDYNISPFTLFHTEDALVETLALKAFDLR